jgi:hypothetical protein
MQNGYQNSRFVCCDAATVWGEYSELIELPEAVSLVRFAGAIHTSKSVVTDSPELPYDAEGQALSQLG